ncbi:MAG: hypothetical protein E6265_22665 [Enterobacteriaceae bacterium]|nr:hypothetical protein [Enterobacteriaceae bacterium]
MHTQKAGLYYHFKLNNGTYCLHEDDVAFCYPSISQAGSYFFTLKNGRSFRGESVKEVMVKTPSPLMRTFDSISVEHQSTSEY